jgi:hypothetical protein
MRTNDFEERPYTIREIFEHPRFVEMFKDERFRRVISKKLANG